VSLTDSNAHALDNCINRAVYKIFVGWQSWQC